MVFTFCCKIFEVAWIKVEPELMNDKAQAEAYAMADFAQSDKLIADAFELHFPCPERQGNILDLGCGPGNMTFQVAQRFPKCQVLGIDGSTEMIRLANARIPESSTHDRVTFITGVIPDAMLPQTHYAAIVSNSLLHHLHHPEVLWRTINQYSSSGTHILIADLFRPASKQDALHIVKKYSADEPDILQRDFYHSLLAAFTPEEIAQQLASAGLDELKLEKITDRHILIFGTKA